MKIKLIDKFIKKIFLLIIVLFFIVSCAQSPGFNKNPKKQNPKRISNNISLNDVE